MATEIKGLGAALMRMRELPKRLQRKGLRVALRKGANIVRDKARAKARGLDDPASSEKIWKNITVRFNSYESKREGGLVFKIGVMGGAAQYGNTRANARKGRVGKTYKTAGSSSNPGGDTWYWRFLELGNRNMRAQPFLRNSLEESAGQVLDVIVDSMNQEVTKEVQKLAQEK